MGRVDCEAVSCATAHPKHPTVAVYSMDQVIMNTRSAVFATLFVVPATDVPAIMTDQAHKRAPPPTSAFRRGRTSDMQTATQFDKN